jgi:hypothetical protein
LKNDKTKNEANVAISEVGDVKLAEQNFKESKRNKEVEKKSWKLVHQCAWRGAVADGGKMPW